MLLSSNLWEEMHAYYFMDAKLSDKKDSVAALRSVHNALVRHFSAIPFTRLNFSKYQNQQKNRGNSKQTMDNHLKVAKHIDKYLSIVDPTRKRFLDDYTFFKDKSIFEFETLTVTEVEVMIAVENVTTPMMNNNEKR